MKLQLSYPVYPVHINQYFGASPEYYARFKDKFGNPEKGHQGIDFQAVHGQPVYAAIDGFAMYSKDEHGGEGCTIFGGQYEYENGTCNFNVINWHLIGDTDPKYPQPFTSQPVKRGDIIGYADNTGAPFESSGDHLHFGLVPANGSGQPLMPGNGYGGCINALPYLGYQLSTLQKIVGILKGIMGLK